MHSVFEWPDQEDKVQKFQTQDTEALTEVD